MRFDFKLITLSVLAASLALQGCSSEMIRETKAKGATTQTEAQTHVDTIKAVAVTPVREIVDDIYIPIILVADEKKIELPEIFNSEIEIYGEFNSLTEVAERITFHTQLPVTISPEILSSDKSSSAGQQPGMGGMPPNPGMMSMPGMGMPGTGNGSSAPSSVRLEFKGKASNFLNLAASRYGVSWRYADGSIEIYRTLTKTIPIRALPGSKVLSSEVSNTSGTSTDGPKIVNNATLSIWSSLGSALNSMKSIHGNVFINEATGTVTITDIPSRVAQMTEYIEQQNAIMGKQVLLSVRVLSISSRGHDERGVNLNAVFNSLSQNFGWTFSSVFQGSPNAASLTMRVLDTAGAVTNANVKSFAGTNAIITALQTQGKVTTLTSWSGITLNNQPAPIMVGRDSAYLQSTSTTVTPNVGSTTTLTQGTFVTGISMNTVPHILEGGELLLESTMSISSLANMFSQTANGNTVQFPEIDKRKLQNSISMRSGQTLILTGFDQNSTDGSEEDTGFGALAGGIKRANLNKDILVILITAVTADKL